MTGVGGAASGPAEAKILLLAIGGGEDIVTSAAFRFRVVGGMVPAYHRNDVRTGAVSELATRL